MYVNSKLTNYAIDPTHRYLKPLSVIGASING